MTLGRSHHRLLRSRRRPQVLALVFAATCLAPLLLAQGSAAKLSGYSTPVRLSGEVHRPGQPNVAVDTAGRATVVWRSRKLSIMGIEAVRLDPAGNPGPIRTLSEPGFREDPRVAVDREGRARVVWRIAWWFSFSPDSRVETARLDAEGNPGPAETLTTTDFIHSRPEIAVDPNGRSTVAWTSFGYDDGWYLDVRAVRLDAAGNPGPVHTFSRSRVYDSVHPWPPDVAVDAEGGATVVWHQVRENIGVWGARLDAAGNPGPVQPLSEVGTRAVDPRVAVDPEGRATVVWRRFPSDPSSRATQAVHIDAAGNPGPIRTLSTAGRDPQVAVDPDGRATVVWIRGDGSNRRVRAVRLDAAGNPGPVQTLSRAGQDASEPQVAVDPDGRATVVWSQDGLRAVRLDPAGNPGPIQRVSGSAITPQVAVDPEGRATVVWEAANGRIMAAHSLRLFEVQAKPKRRTVGPRRKRVRYRFRATNRDTEPSGLVRLCARAPKRRVKIRGERCRAFADIAPGASAERMVRLRLRNGARGKLTEIKLIARGPNVHADTTARLSVGR